MTTTDFVNRVFRNATKRTKVMVYLTARLTHGPINAMDAEKICKTFKVSPSTMERAARDLGVKKRRMGYSREGFWQWELAPALSTVGWDLLHEATLQWINDAEQNT